MQKPSFLFPLRSMILPLSLAHDINLAICQVPSTKQQSCSELRVEKGIDEQQGCVKTHTSTHSTNSIIFISSTQATTVPLTVASTINDLN